MISDNAASAGVVIRGCPIRPGARDLRWISALMYRNGVIKNDAHATIDKMPHLSGGRRLLHEVSHV